MLAELADIRGVAGDEKRVRSYLVNKLEGKGTEIKVDTMGNVLVRKQGSKTTKRIMLAAHMDEIGLMVTEIDKSGLLRFAPVGGIDHRILVAKRVLVGDEALPGVIGSKPVHLQEQGEESKPFPLASLYIDCGFTDNEQAKKNVKVGDYITFDVTCESLGEGFLRGKAFDDRAGCYILLELLLENNKLAFDVAFTVQEEVGTRGAQVAAYALQPEIALAVEATAASDTPGTDKEFSSTIVGKGPAISVMDRTIIVKREFREKLVKAADGAEVAYQYRRFTGGGTDAGVISLSRNGVEAGTVAIPCRYIHSPYSIMQESDLQGAVKLVRSWLELNQ